MGHSHLNNSMRMFLSWTIFLLFPISQSDDWSNVLDGWSDESIDESWDKSEETTKGSSKKEGTTQTTQTTRADGTGVPDIPGSFTTTIGGYSYSNSEHTTLSCLFYPSGAMVQGQICLAPLGGWRTCRLPSDDCNLDWPKLYKDLKIAYEEYKEKMEKMKVKMANMKVNMDRKMKKLDEKMAKMNEKFSAPCFPFC